MNSEKRRPGRPNGKLPVKLCCKVSQRTRDYLSTLVTGTISDHIESLISSSKGFKKWDSESFPEK